MVVNNLSIIFAVSMSFLLIKLRSKLFLQAALAISMADINATVFLVLSYLKLGEANQRSKEFLGSWKRKAGYLHPATKIQMKKFLKSSPPLRVDLGEFGYYSKPASIRIVGKLVTYTVKFLMLTSKFGI